MYCCREEQKKKNKSNSLKYDVEIICSFVEGNSLLVGIVGLRNLLYGLDFLLNNMLLLKGNHADGHFCAAFVVNNNNNKNRTRIPLNNKMWRSNIMHVV